MFDANMVIGLSLLAGSICLLVICYNLWWCWLMNQIPKSSPAIQVSVSTMEQLERSIGGSLPSILKSAYLDGSVTRLALPTVFQWRDSEYCINQLIRADAQANRQLTKFHLIPQTAFIFAADDFGNYYFVKANDNAVYFWDHDLGGEVTEIFESAEDFWKFLQAKPSIS